MDISTILKHINEQYEVYALLILFAFALIYLISISNRRAKFDSQIIFSMVFWSAVTSISIFAVVHLLLIALYIIQKDDDFDILSQLISHGNLHLYLIGSGAIVLVQLYQQVRRFIKKLTSSPRRRGF